MNGNCQYSQADLDIMVLSGKKPVKKAEDALAFGDAAIEATTARLTRQRRYFVIASRTSFVVCFLFVLLCWERSV